MVIAFNIFRLAGLAVVLACLASFASVDSAVAAESVCQPYSPAGATVCGSTTTLANDAAYPGTVSRGTMSGTAPVDCAYLNTRAFNDDRVEGWELNASLRYPATGCVAFASSFSYTSPKVPAGSYAGGAYQCDAADVRCYVVTRHSFEGPGTAQREFYTSNDGTRSCPAAWSTPGGPECNDLESTTHSSVDTGLDVADVAGTPPAPPNDATWRAPVLPTLVDVPPGTRYFQYPWSYNSGEVVITKVTQKDAVAASLYRIELKTKSTYTSSSLTPFSGWSQNTWLGWQFDAAARQGPAVHNPGLGPDWKEVWMNTNFWVSNSSPFGWAGYEAWQYLRNRVSKTGQWKMHNSSVKFEAFPGLFFKWCRFISTTGNTSSARRHYCEPE